MPVATDVALQEMENHKAETGDEWVANEMQVLIGGQKYWNWNVMDSVTLSRTHHTVPYHPFLRRRDGRR